MMRMTTLSQVTVKGGMAKLMKKSSNSYDYTNRR